MSNVLYQTGTSGTKGTEGTENTRSTHSTRCTQSEYESILLELKKTFGDKVLKPEIETKLPKEVIKKFLRDGILGDLGLYYLINLEETFIEY